MTEEQETRQCKPLFHLLQHSPSVTHGKQLFFSASLKFVIYSLAISTVLFKRGFLPLTAGVFIIVSIFDTSES